MRFPYPESEKDGLEFLIFCDCFIEVMPLFCGVVTDSKGGETNQLTGRSASRLRSGFFEVDLEILLYSETGVFLY